MSDAPKITLASLMKKQEPAAVAAPVVVEQPITTPPAAEKPNPFAALRKSVAAAAAPSVAKPAPAKPVIGISIKQPATVIKGVDAGSAPAKTAALITLDDIGDLNIEIAEPVTKPDASRYVHEGQVTQLGTEAIEQFRLQMQDLEASFNSFDVPNAIRRVLTFMRERPFLKEHLLPEDCQLMVRALRQSYGVVVTAKETNKKKKSARSVVTDDILADLGDITF